jgi:hypothetical protein
LLDNRNKFLAVKTHLVDHYLSSYFLFNFSHFNLKSVWLIMMSQGSHGFMTTHKWRDSVGASINVEASGTAGPGRIWSNSNVTFLNLFRMHMEHWLNDLGKRELHLEQKTESSLWSAEHTTSFLYHDWSRGQPLKVSSTYTHIISE